MTGGGGMEEGRARFLEASILGAQRDIPKAWGSFRAPFCFCQPHGEGSREPRQHTGQAAPPLWVRRAPPVPLGPAALKTPQQLSAKRAHPVTPQNSG